LRLLICAARDSRSLRAYYPQSGLLPPAPTRNEQRRKVMILHLYIKTWGGKAPATDQVAAVEYERPAPIETEAVRTTVYGSAGQEPPQFPLLPSGGLISAQRDRPLRKSDTAVLKCSRKVVVISRAVRYHVGNHA